MRCAESPRELGAPPRLRGREAPARRGDGRRRGRATRRGRAPPARRGGLLVPLRHRGRGLPRLGPEGRGRLHRHGDRPRPQPARLAGPPDDARAQAEALLGQLPPARAAARRAAAPPPGVGRGRRACAEPRRGLAHCRLARAGGVRPDGDPHPGPPEPHAHPHGRRLGGAPAAEGLPDRRRARPVLERRVVAVAPEKPRTPRTREWPLVGPPIYEGSHIPSPTPTVLEVPEERRASDDILQVNFGPNHPSTHGVLRLIVDLDGEEVVGLAAVIGYLHTGFEKNMEQKTWWKAITYPERIDYVGYQNNELVFVLAIEKLLELEV